MTALARMTRTALMCATLGISTTLVPDIASAQPANMGCASTQGANNTQTLRCRGDVIIVAEDGAKFTLQSHNKSGDVDAVDLQGKAVLVDAPKQKAKQRFQVITPQAIAAVRGTKWAVDVAGNADLGPGAERPGRGAAARRRPPGATRSGRRRRRRSRQHRTPDREALGAAARRCADGAARAMIPAADHP